MDLEKKHTHRFITIRESLTHLDRIIMLIGCSYVIGPQRSGFTRSEDNQDKKNLDELHDLNE